jgi:hypothetical protein
MTLLNVSFGIYAFLPLGWIFMAVIIYIECLSGSKFLTQKWKNFNIYKSIITSNFISGIIGIIASLQLNGGWWLTVWFPWVSNHEINLSNKRELSFLVIYYLCAFLITLIIEFLVNYFFLRKEYKISKIVFLTLIVNAISYIFGSIVLYSYSFSS